MVKPGKNDFTALLLPSCLYGGNYKAGQTKNQAEYRRCHVESEMRLIDIITFLLPPADDLRR